MSTVDKKSITNTGVMDDNAVVTHLPLVSILECMDVQGILTHNSDDTAVAQQKKCDRVQ